MPRRTLRRIEKTGRRVPFRKGVAILPSLFTVANMFFGYYAIILSTKGRFKLAVSMVIMAGILDSLDGRIARMTNTTSDFGKELDSLSDFLSFGLAPALILYNWGFKDLGRSGWLLAFLLPVAGAMRLARFNVQVAHVDKKYFVGLPIPAAAAAAVLPLYYLPAGLPPALKAGALVYVVSLAWLMVSRIKFRSFKELDLRARRSSMLIFLVALVLILIAWNPPAVLLGIAVTYAASGPIGWVLSRYGRRRVGPRAGEEKVQPEGKPEND